MEKQGLPRGRLAGAVVLAGIAVTGDAVIAVGALTSGLQAAQHRQRWSRVGKIMIGRNAARVSDFDRRPSVVRIGPDWAALA